MNLSIHIKLYIKLHTMTCPMYVTYVEIKGFFKPIFDPNNFIYISRRKPVVRSNKLRNKRNDLSDETVKTEVLCHSGYGPIKVHSCLQTEGAGQRSTCRHWYIQDLSYIYICIKFKNFEKTLHSITFEFQIALQTSYIL